MLTGVYGAMVKRLSRKMVGDVPRAGRGGLAQPEGAELQLRPRPRCGFCLDLGYFQAHNDGLDLTKAREVPRWRESDVFTPVERDVMAYAEAMTQTPPTVTDELSARLLDQLGAPALVELTAVVAPANLAARSNTAFGIDAQGFAAAGEGDRRGPLAVSLTVENGRITRIYAIGNPHKLARLDTEVALTR